MAHGAGTAASERAWGTRKGKPAGQTGMTDWPLIRIAVV
jgi:hypothetical protein